MAFSVLLWVSFLGTGKLGFIAITLICWAIGLSSLFGSLWHLAGRSRLEIDQQNFRLQWMILGLTIRQIQGKTVDIEENPTYLEMTDAFFEAMVRGEFRVVTSVVTLYC